MINAAVNVNESYQLVRCLTVEMIMGSNDA